MTSATTLQQPRKRPHDSEIIPKDTDSSPLRNRTVRARTEKAANGPAFGSASSSRSQENDFLITGLPTRRLSMPLFESATSAVAVSSRRILGKKPTYTQYFPAYRPFRNADGSLKGPIRYDSAESLEKKPKFFQNAVSIQKDNRINWHEQNVDISIQPQMMNGQFKVIAKIAPDQESLIEGIPNDQLLVTTFRDHCIMAQFGQDKLPINAHSNVLKQYDRLRTESVPVAEIYNTNEARNGCGFFLVEYVPHAFELSWEKGAKIASLTPDQLARLNQVRDVFQKTYHAGIIGDLQPNNFRFRNDGTLTLIDIREHDIDDDERDLEFRKMLLAFACDKDDEIYNYLNPITSSS